MHGQRKAFGVGAQGDRIWPQHPNPVWATGKIERKKPQMRLPWTGSPEFHVRAPAREADAHGRCGGDDGGGPKRGQLGTIAGGTSPIRQPSARRTVDSRKSRQSMCQVSGRLSRSRWKVSSRFPRTW